MKLKFFRITVIGNYHQGFLCFRFCNLMSNFERKNVTVTRISSVRLLSCVQLFATPWTAARQASLITNSQSLLRLISIESVMPSNNLILCHPLLLPPSVFPCIRVFSNESALHSRWPSVLPMNIQD